MCLCVFSPLTFSFLLLNVCQYIIVVHLKSINACVQIKSNESEFFFVSKRKNSCTTTRQNKKEEIHPHAQCNAILIIILKCYLWKIKKEQNSKHHYWTTNILWFHVSLFLVFSFFLLHNIYCNRLIETGTWNKFLILISTKEKMKQILFLCINYK